MGLEGGEGGLRNSNRPPPSPLMMQRTPIPLVMRIKLCSGAHVCSNTRTILGCRGVWGHQFGTEAILALQLVLAPVAIASFSLGLKKLLTVKNHHENITQQKKRGAFRCGRPLRVPAKKNIGGYF